MRLVITGLDGEGHSCVTSIEDVNNRFQPRGADGSVATADVWKVDELPVRLPVGAVTDLPVKPTNCPDRGAIWKVARFMPGITRPVHRTGTVDVDIVLEGSCELVLEAGAVALQEGDWVVLPGVVHFWRTGAQGCLMGIMLLAGAKPNAAEL